LQVARKFRPGIVIIAVGLSFVAIPYIVDIAFLWDLTPTHFAQEKSVAGEHFEDIDYKGPLFGSSDSDFRQHSDSSAPSHVQVNLSVSPLCPALILISASTASRPPPACNDQFRNSATPI